MRRRMLVLMALLLLFGVGTALWLGSLIASPNPRDSSPQPTVDECRITLFSPTPCTFDLDDLARGGRVERTFVLENPGSVAVQVTNVTTSCECFHVDLPIRVLEPGGSTTGTLIVDLRHDPQFVGGLLLQADGTVNNETPGPAFVIRVKVRVL